MSQLTKTQTKVIKSLLKPQEGSLTAQRSRKSGNSTPRNRSRSRSAGRARSNSRGKKKVNGAGFRSGMFRKQFVKDSILKLQPVLKVQREKQKQMALIKEGYFNGKDMKAPDVKVQQQEMDNLVKEIQLAVGAIRAGLGDKPIRLRMNTTFVLTATVTSGVVNTVTINSGNNNMSPAGCSEWSTAALLFAEYKCHGGEFVFNYVNPTLEGKAAAATPNGLPVIAYDCSGDQSNAGSSAALCSQSQHKILTHQHFNSSANATSDFQGNHHKFRWHTPRGTVVPGPTSSVNMIPGDEWIPIDLLAIVGVAKFYHEGTTVSAVDVGAGILFYDLEFRCRE